LKFKRIAPVAIGLLAVGVGIYYISESRLASEVDDLVGQAHGRGIKTRLNSILLDHRTSGTQEFRRLAGVSADRDLVRLKFGAENIPEARRLIASADPYFAPIAEFASIERYSPRQFYDSSTTFDDYTTLAAAAQAVGWRGYLSAEGMRGSDALASIGVLTGLMRRLHDETVPIGTTIAYLKVQKWICRIAARLAEQTSDPALIEKLQTAVSTLPKADYKGGLSWELAGGLELLDKYESGEYEVGPPIQFINLQFRFARSHSYYLGLRADLLRAVVRAYDTWETAPLAMVTGLVTRSDPDNFAVDFIASAKETMDMQRRNERNDITDRRAIALVLAAYKLRVETGKVPTIQQLEASGLNVTDPWNGKKMTLHSEGTRLWVGAERTNPKSLDPTPQVVEVLSWRPY